MQRPFLIIIKDAICEMIQNEKIIYLTVSDHYTQLKLVDGRTLRVKKSLRSFEQQLPPHLFLRTHKSYIICINHIKLVGKDVTMINGDELPISKECRESFLSNFYVV